MPPVVSVVMPAYNTEKYIQEAVSSIEKQTLKDWELLVVDDCSTDQTYDILLKLAQEDARIRIIRNQTNCGAAMSRNIAFSQCSGKYVALLDSDDLWEPEKLEKQVMCAEKTGADIIYCSYSIIDEYGRKKSPDFIVPEHTDFDSMLKKSTISCSTALLKSELVVQFQFPTHMYHEDLAYWLELLKNGANAVGVTEVLASYRIIPGSRTFNKVQSAVNRWKIYTVYLGLPAVRSMCLLVQYMFLGLIKYRKKARNGTD